MGKKAVYPMVGFQAAWPARSYEFAHGVSVVRLTESLRSQMHPIYPLIQDTSADPTLWISEFLDWCDWALLTDWFEEGPYFPPPVVDLSWIPIVGAGESGTAEPGSATMMVSDRYGFSGPIRAAFCDTFLMALRILRRAQILCPVVFKAEAGSEGMDLEDARETEDISGRLPDGFWTTYREADSTAFGAGSSRCVDSTKNPGTR